MKEKFLKSGFLFIIIGILFYACAPNGPSNESIKNDWNEFIKSHSREYCVSFTNFEILSNNYEGVTGEVLVKVSGDWNGKTDSVETSGPCKSFKKSNGKNQSVELKMVYEKSSHGWNLKGFQPK